MKIQVYVSDRCLCAVAVVKRETPRQENVITCRTNDLVVDIIAPRTKNRYQCSVRVCIKKIEK